MSSRSRALFLPSLLVIGTLALAGCGASGTSSDSGAAPASDRSVFEFGSTPDSAPGGEVTVQLPDGLVEALKIDGVTVPVKSVTLRSQKVTSTSLCAVKGHVEFNEGGEAIATAPTRTTDDVDAEKDPGIEELNLKTGDLILGMVSDLQQSGELPEGAFEEAQKAPYDYYKANLQGKDPGLDAQIAEMEKNDLSSDAEIAADKASEKERLDGMTPANWAARYYGVMMRPKGEMSTPYGSEILPASQFDANKPEEGVYMDSPDSFVEVLPCATSVDDNGSGVKESFGFQRVDNESESGSSDFAFVTFSVMRDGTILIPSAKVNGYTRDGSGSWVQDRN